MITQKCYAKYKCKNTVEYFISINKNSKRNKGLSEEVSKEYFYRIIQNGKNS